MAEKEKELINKRLLSLNPNERLFRSNAGLAWVGSEYVRKGNILIIKNPRPFHGMPIGWPDLTGFTEKIITPEMIDTNIAIFTVNEAKATGRLSKEQKMIQELILRMGGIYEVIR